ncbi:MAG: helix-turn-helix transcriptional regulator [Alistipes sp.]|nr:helix-turn-helix transcriptional regulator [Alistipes sp.]
MDYETEIIKIAQTIKRIRLEKGLSVQELAYRCNIERSNLSRLEAGRTNMTVKTLCTICKALEIELSDIIK